VYKYFAGIDPNAKPIAGVQRTCIPEPERANWTLIGTNLPMRSSSQINTGKPACGKRSVDVAISSSQITGNRQTTYLSLWIQIDLLPKFFSSRALRRPGPGARYVLSATISGNIHDANLILAGLINFILYSGIVLWLIIRRSRKRRIVSGYLH
jgi:hypothetical protein